MRMSRGLTFFYGQLLSFLYNQLLKLGTHAGKTYMKGECIEKNFKDDRPSLF